MKYLFIIYTWEGHSWFYHKFKTTKFYHELMNRDDIEVVKFQLPKEDYSQLPMKTYKMLEWAMDYDFDYLIKCDVNTFCNPRIMYLPTWDVEKVCSDESDYWGVYLCRTRWHELESWKEVKGFSDYCVSFCFYTPCFCELYEVKSPYYLWACALPRADGLPVSNPH